MKRLSDFVRKEENIWVNFKVDSNKAYVFYSGNHDFSGLTDALIPLLSKRYKKPVETIKIVGRVGPFKENIIAYNSNLDEMMEDKTTYKWFRSATRNLKPLFESNYFQNLSQQILDNQKELFLDVFSNNKLPKKYLSSKIKVLAPSQDLVERFYDKFEIYEFLEKQGFPMPEGYRVKGKKAAIELFKEKFNEGIFVSKKTSFGGSGCRIFNNIEDLQESDFLTENEEYFVKRKINMLSSPSMSGIVGNENEVLLLYAFDQIIKGTKADGAKFPSELSSKLRKEISDMTFEVGCLLGKECFRSFYNVDFMITPNGELYVAEMNPRKFGSIMEFFACNEALKLEGYPSLAEIGFNTITENRLGVNSFDINPKNLYWGRQTIRLSEEVIIKNDLEGYLKDAESGFKFKGNAFYNTVPKGTKIPLEESGYLGDLLVVSNKPFDQISELNKHEKIIKERMIYQDA